MLCGKTSIDNGYNTINAPGLDPPPRQQSVSHINKDEFGYIILDETSSQTTRNQDEGNNVPVTREDSKPRNVCVDYIQDEFGYIVLDDTQSTNTPPKVCQSLASPSSNEIDYDLIYEDGTSYFRDKDRDQMKKMSDTNQIVDEGGYLVPNVSLDNNKKQPSTTAQPSTTDFASNPIDDAEETQFGERRSMEMAQLDFPFTK